MAAFRMSLVVLARTEDRIPIRFPDKHYQTITL